MRLTSSRCAYPCRWRKMAKDEICPDRFPRMGQMSRSGHQAEALGADNGRSPAVYADLLVKVREVVAHGLFGDAQLPRDLCIAGAFAQQAKGLAFALAQGSKHFSRLGRSEEHTSELQSLMRISYAVFCLKQNITTRLLYLILYILISLSHTTCCRNVLMSYSITILS